MPEQPTITWTLPMEQANAVLVILGHEPFERVADLIMELRTQAGRQVQAWNDEQQMKQAPPKPNGGMRADA